MSGIGSEGKGLDAVTIEAGCWSHAEAERAISLALLVVRAGARDSLEWWEDEALTEAGAFALRRIFPREPKRVAVRLAFRAAVERHAGALTSAGRSGAVTLVGLTAPLVEGAAGMPAVPDEPIPSMDDLRRRMRELAPRLDGYRIPEPEGSGLLDLTALAKRGDCPPGESAILLAAGYLTAQKGKPIYPYICDPNEFTW